MNKDVLEKLDELIAESRLTRSAVQRIGSRVAETEARVTEVENRVTALETSRNGSHPPNY